MADGQGPVVVSVINMKGGVGKTTIAAMLARWLTSMRPFTRQYGSSGMYTDTLTIDLDPQANLSQALMGGRRCRDFLNAQSPSIVEVFKGYQPPNRFNPSPHPLSMSSVVHSIGGRSSPNDSSLALIPSRSE
ncbi:MAG: ParA family protein [Chloroflexi bacterium]|nr:ParA family protein [Chloroflexota bacterium]